jgi:hypothetical protein
MPNIRQSYTCKILQKKKEGTRRADYCKGKIKEIDEKIIRCKKYTKIRETANLSHSSKPTHSHPNEHEQMPRRDSVKNKRRP